MFHFEKVPVLSRDFYVLDAKIFCLCLPADSGRKRKRRSTLEFSNAIGLTEEEVSYLLTFQLDGK